MTAEMIGSELTRSWIKPTLDVRMDGEPTGGGGVGLAERDDTRTRRRRQQTPEEILEDEARKGVESLKKRLNISDTQIAPMLLQFAQQHGREITNEELRRLLSDIAGGRGNQEVIRNNMAAAKARWEAQQAQQGQNPQREELTDEDSEDAENEPLIFQAGPLAPILEYVKKNAHDGKISQQVYHNALSNAQGLIDQGQITEDDFRKFEQRLTPYSNQSPEMARIQAEFEQKERRKTNVRSIQDVALRIINDEGKDRWGPPDKDGNGAGVFPLLDAEGNINQANFLRWVRERMMYYHDQDSSNFELNMFGSVGIQNEFGSKTPILTMIDNRAQFFKDAKSGKTLDSLVKQVELEVWLFGTSRNNDILYQFNMSNDEKLPEFLQRVHLKNEFTKGNHLQVITSMAEDFGEEGDTKLGDAVRRAYEIYYNISDYEKLEEILGRDSLFFNREAYENAFRILEKKNIGEAISAEATGLLNTIFLPNGQPNIGKFLDVMNPFNAQEKDEYHLKISREMIKQVVASEYGLEYGLGHSMDDKIGETTRRDFLRKPLEYAELWAYSMTRWTGAGANNDINNIGFDAFTKTMRTRGYRVRQSAHTRAGQFGNEYNLGVMKGLTVDLLNAIRVEPTPGDDGARMTPFEIMTQQNQLDAAIRGVLRGRQVSELTPEESSQVTQLIEEKNHLGDKLRFRQFTQNSYSSNHLNRAFTVFHSLMGDKGLWLEEIVKWDPFRGLTYDRGQFEEQVKEGFLKPIRYAFSTYPGIDFGKSTREQIGFEKAPDGTNVPIYRDVTLAEKMFGPEVLAEVKKKAYMVYEKNKYFTEEEKSQYVKDGHLTEEGKHLAFSRYISDESSSSGGRPLLWKYAARARIAKELLSHREFGNGYQFFNHMMAEKFILALETIKAVEVLEEDYDNEETRMRYGEHFFNHEDIAWIKNHCKMRRIDILKEFGKEGLYGLGKGLWEGFGEFFEHVFK